MERTKQQNFFRKHIVLVAAGVVLLIGVIVVVALMLGIKAKGASTTANASYASVTPQTTALKAGKSGACTTGSVAHLGVGKYTIGSDLSYGTYQVADDGTVDTSSTPIYAYFTIYADKATYGTDGYADHQTVELDSKTGTQTAKLDNGNYLEVTVGAKLTCE
jgi:hypothetical protein